MIVVGPYIFGSPDPKKIINLPDGCKKYRIKLRVDEVARCFVMRDGQVTEHYIMQVDGGWMLSEAHSRNVRPSSATGALVAAL